MTKEVGMQDLRIERWIVEIHKQFVKIAVVTSFNLICVFVEVDDVGDGATVTQETTFSAVDSQLTVTFDVVSNPNSAAPCT